MAKHKNIKKIELLLEEMQNDFDEKNNNLDEDEIGEAKYNQRTEYYDNIADNLCFIEEYITELKELKLTDF